jgi:hypothetical protein
MISMYSKFIFHLIGFKATSIIPNNGQTTSVFTFHCGSRGENLPVLDVDVEGCDAHDIVDILYIVQTAMKFYIPKSLFSAVNYRVHRPPMLPNSTDVCYFQNLLDSEGTDILGETL